MGNNDQIQGVPPGLTEQPIAPSGGSGIQGVPPGLSEQPVQSGGAGGDWDTAAPPDPSDDSQGHGVLANAAIGFGKGALQTTSGIGELIHAIPGVGPAIIPEEGLEREQQLSTTHGTAQGIGAGAESVAEWAAGDEALEGIAKLAKVPSRVLALAEKYPKTAALIHGATVGATQGAVKGAAQGDAVGGAEGGAVGGAAGAWTGEALSQVVSAGLEKLGVNTPAMMDAVKAAKPEKWNKNFVSDWETAAPKIVETLKGDTQFKDMWDAANSIGTTK